MCTSTRRPCDSYPPKSRRTLPRRVSSPSPCNGQSLALFTLICGRYTHPEIISPPTPSLCLPLLSLSLCLPLRLCRVPGFGEGLGDDSKEQFAVSEDENCIMVAAISSTPNPNPKNSSHQNPRRPPLLPSEGENVVPPQRRPKSREVTSRYLSSSSSSSTSSSASSAVQLSRRFPSPSVSRTVPLTPMPGRSQSVERRRAVTPRPGTPGNSGELWSTASKMLFTSTRSLSVSFQGESFTLQVSKAKPAPVQTPTVRKATPERRRAVTPSRGGRNDADRMENTKPVDQHRWPGRSRPVDFMTKSLNVTEERGKLGGSPNMVRTLEQSIIDERIRSSADSKSGSDLGNVMVKSVSDLGNGMVYNVSERVVDTTLVNGSAFPLSESITSDTESVSSGSTSGIPECGNVVQGRNGQRGVVVPARFWQETNNRLRHGRLTELGSPGSKSMSSKTTSNSRLITPRKLSTDSPVSSPKSMASIRGLASPIRGAVRPASPSKLPMPATSSSMRGIPSPTRVRSGVAGALNMPSVLSFAADMRRGKMGENRIEDAHSLRLLYNRILQWRFVNARVDTAMSVQAMTAKKSLYDAWMTIEDLRNSVGEKRILLQMLRHNLKLMSILKRHMIYLEEWALMDRDHSSSLFGAIEALKASTLRLPVVGGARAEVHNIQDAICSAVDVMQAMASSIRSLFLKVEEINSVVELASVAAKERALLVRCKDLLSIIASFQVKEYSLRTHAIQLKRVP